MTTTKPPERRESVLPWHSFDKEDKSHSQTESRFPKWQQSRNNTSSKSSTKNWSPWWKAPDSQIEQRKQIDIHDNIPEQIPEQVPEQISEQQRDFDRLGQQKENLKSFRYGESDKNYGRFKDDSKYGNRPENEIDFEYKQSAKGDSAKDTYVEIETENLYEGIATDSTVILFLDV